MRSNLRLWAWHAADWWKRMRRRAKESLPFVRRRNYRILQRKYSDLVEAIHRGLPPAAQASLEVRKPAGAIAGRACLFVTHAPQRELKTHVTHHIDHLLRSGLNIVLIVNTDLPLAEIIVPDELAVKLEGVYVRQNRGFDFGAWSHVLALCDRSGWERLYLVNDSIVGPLTQEGFDAMMARIEASDADVIGLTQNPQPIAHLQSYFLVFSRRVLASPEFDSLMRDVRNFDDKGQVVEIYELRTTRSLQEAGFTIEALYDALPDGRASRGDLLVHWKELLDAGFPYVKTRVLQEHPGNKQLQAVRLRACVDNQIR